MQLVCIKCPRGCRLDVSDNLEVSGNACAKGAEYAKEETTNPRRIVTGLVKVAGRRQPLSVKTKQPVPKSEIFDVLSRIAAMTVRPPVRIGDEILPNVVATAELLV